MSDKMYPTAEIETMRAAVAAYDAAQANPMMEPGTPDPSDTMLLQDAPGGMIATVPPAYNKMAEDNEIDLTPSASAYKCVELCFGDAAVVLRGDGSLGGDLDAFTAALETINPAADDVAFAVGWLVARVARLTERLNALPEDRIVYDVVAADPDPGDADPSEPAEEMFPEGRRLHALFRRRTPWSELAPEDKAEWQSRVESNLSERATHEAAQRRVTGD